MIGTVGSGSALALKNVNVFDSDVVEVASCNPTVSITATCNAATISNSGVDSDSDGVPDYADNCPDVSNTNQADGDTDYLGDACEPSYGTNMADPDTDNDGCYDGVEVHDQVFSPASGGDRDPLSMWDFFDVTGDRAIDLSDTLDVLGYFGQDGSGASNLRDRAVANQLKPWQLIEANDGVDLTDALNNLTSFGHDCT